MRIKELTHNGSIVADEIIIGKNVIFGKDIDIKVRGTFKIGDNGYIGDRFRAYGENIILGDHFFYIPTDSREMFIGGGGSGFPYANLTIGDRCTCHTGHINLAREVTIGNDVGLSHDVDIITHGFWASPFKGFPQKTAPVVIGNNVIIGWKSIIMPDVHITDDVVIGAGAVVTKDIDHRGIYGGVPVKRIGDIVEPKDTEKVELLYTILDEFEDLLHYYHVPPYFIFRAYPLVTINDLTINVDTLTCEGEHDEITDAFRDFIRRYGIRIFHKRGFEFKLERK
jgi:acetyltransferase-like isoleucine patch superfamily enzyme